MQEAGPGFKQDIFSDVEGLNDGDIIKLSKFKYWNKATKDFVEKSGAKLYLANLILEMLQFSAPDATSYLKIDSTSSAANFPEIRIVNQNGTPIVTINTEEVSMINNLMIGPVKFITDNIEDSSVLILRGAIEDKAILRGIKSDINHEDSAVNYGQLNGKQNKIAESDALVFARATVETIVIRGLQGYSTITSDGTNIKFSIGGTNKAELTNIKDGTADDSAASVAQLNAVDKIAKAADSNASVARATANEAKDIATTASDTAEAAQNTANSARQAASDAAVTAGAAQSQVSVLENKISQLKSTEANAITAQSVSNISELTNSTIKLIKMYDNLYTFSGTVTIRATTAGNCTIGFTVPTELGANFNVISSVVGSSTVNTGVQTSINSFAVDNRLVTVNFSAEQSATVAQGIGVTVIFKIEE